MGNKAREPQVDFDGVPPVLIGTNGQPREVDSLPGGGKLLKQSQ